MSDLIPKLAPILLALTLTISGVTLAATASAPTLPGPIAPFGCYA
ncbi:MAG TPA: hypothetical protein VD846_14085 [Allosphingosinicella sp.]|nr:hypothetical protein [Allosphingosinicella sp.]